MATIKMGLFDLVDPPTNDDRHSQKEWIESVTSAYETTDYPWHRIIPWLRKNNRESIRVVWAPHLNGNLGTYSWGQINMSMQYGTAGADFTWVHEAGHMVDATTFTWQQQQDMMTLFHDCRSRYTGQEMNGGPHGWSHDQPHSENWVSNNDYLFRHNEAFADAFVAAFNPHVWGQRGDYGRFVHWPVNYDAQNHHPDGVYYHLVRAITLEHPIMAFTDVPADHPHRDGIEWAAGQGLVKGQADGKFNPEKAVSRAQLCTILHRQSQAG